MTDPQSGSTPILSASIEADALLEDMIRLGFWDAAQEWQLPEGEDTALNSLDSVAEKNIEKEAAPTLSGIERHAQCRLRVQAWQSYWRNHVDFLGEGVSAGLGYSSWLSPASTVAGPRPPNLERLQAFGLPVIEHAQQLAEVFGIGLAELRFLSYSRRTSTVRHYRQFVLPKKSGGERRISAPLPRLKRLQYWILENILLRLPVHGAAHGFVSGRSILSNAKMHVGANVLVNLDLKDFFPSIRYSRVKGLFCSWGYGEQVATILALLCTEFDFQQVSLNEQVYFVGEGERKLPQGAPTSPAISNLICRRLDQRLVGMAANMEFRYTRYADDLSFSTLVVPARNVTKLLWRIRQIVRAEGFAIHPYKTAIMRKHRRQTVTGLVVNEKINLDRRAKKRLRALFHEIERNGVALAHWQGIRGAKLWSVIKGYVHYIAMVNLNDGAQWLARLQNIKYKFNLASITSHTPRLPKTEFRRLAALGQAPYPNWLEARAKSFPGDSISAASVAPSPDLVPAIASSHSAIADSDFDKVVIERLAQIEDAPRRPVAHRRSRLLKWSIVLLILGVGVISLGFWL